MTSSIIEESKDIILSRLQPSRSEYALRSADVMSADFGNLVLSIKGMGLLEPIGVMKAKEEGEYEVVVGTRRYEAAKLAYEKKPDTPIPCVVYKKLSAVDAKTVMALENIHRKALTPQEMYALVKDLKKAGVSRQKDIASTLSVSESYVSQVITAMKGYVGEKSLKERYGKRAKHRLSSQVTRQVKAKCPACDAEITYDPSTGTFYTESSP